MKTFTRILTSLTKTILTFQVIIKMFSYRKQIARQHSWSTI